MKDEMEWHSGPPPHVGWWVANRLGVFVLWRWWDGEKWSMPAHQKDSKRVAARCASASAVGSIKAIRWCHYYPANARVPRINPEAA